MLDRIERTFGEDVFAKAALVSGIVFAVIYAAYLFTLHFPYDFANYLIGWDYVNVWMGARGALAGHVHALFDVASYLKQQHSLFPAMQPHNWSYPPDVLLFIWPLGLFPYLPSYVLWTLAGAGVFMATALQDGATPRKAAFLLLAPAVIVNIFAGQNGLFTSALLIGGLLNLDRRPWLAGLCLGLLTLKPQLGLLIPVALILSWRWRPIVAAAATTAVLFAMSSAIFGLSAWSDYVHLALPIQTKVMNYGGPMMLAMAPTPFMNARLLGLSHEAALWVQIPFTLMALAAVIWTFSAKRDPELSRAVLITACFIATPYMFDYDMPIFGWLIWRLRDRFSNRNDMGLALAVWAMPAIAIFMGLCGVPGSGLVLPTLLLRLVWMLRAENVAAFEPVAKPLAL